MGTGFDRPEQTPVARRVNTVMTLRTAQKQRLIRELSKWGLKFSRIILHSGVSLLHVYYTMVRNAEHVR